MSWVKPVDGFFPVTSIHRADLEDVGFDGGSLSDEEMERLAERVGEAYTATGVFWEHLKMVAEEMGVRKLKRRKRDE